jgi:radical SAM superfamily enzyme YgiQ (UPF0313 family)
MQTLTKISPKGENMKILLVYPETPITYWGFQHALKFISKKAAFPPLGLLTVAAMLPERFEIKLIDMNVETLKNDDIRWADYVFISAMVIQKESVRDVIGRCRKIGVKTVAGGPLFTAEFESYDEVDHLILNEGEITMTEFLHDLEFGAPKHIYRSTEWADMSRVPAPKWELINVKKYGSLNIQYSRGCPFNCEFCDITALFGHIPRTKSAGQLIDELDAIYHSGWRGDVFFVDDNFIGNKRKLINEILPAMIAWMDGHERPFRFLTEASINLADDDALMSMIVKAGFYNVFIGIETPDELSLSECKKIQNKNRDLIASIKKIQQHGLEVQGGFIVGFDNDKPSIFNRMVSFIQESGIVTAMVGLLNAPKGTSLYKRLQGEGRLTDEFSGDNTNFTMNFIPKMDRNELVNGYESIVSTIYSPKHYYERVLNFLKTYNPNRLAKQDINPGNIFAFLKSIFRLGVFGKERRYYWKLLSWSFVRRPEVFPMAVRFTIYGFHFRKIYAGLLDRA